MVRSFFHYWIAGIVIAVVGGLMLWLASIPLQVVSGTLGDERGALILDSWWKALIAVLELLFFPFAFGWLLHRVITRPGSVLKDILSKWSSDVQEEEQQENAEL